jgi:hypothetical protein
MFGVVGDLKGIAGIVGGQVGIKTRGSPASVLVIGARENAPEERLSRYLDQT